MRIGIISDLHLEFGEDFRWVPDVDVLVLAGDIGTGTAGIDWCRAHLPPRLPVIYVPGNHEFYGHEMNETIAAMKQQAAGTHVHVLNNNYVLIGGVRFVGTTLWTDYKLQGDVDDVTAMRRAARDVSDHTLIKYQRDDLTDRRFTPWIAQMEHQFARRYLAQALDSFYSDTQVVVTHHAPSGRSIAAKFEGHPLNSCFASALDDFISEAQPKLWIHGHVHSSFDYAIGETRVIANPRGYPRPRHPNFENPDFSPAFIVDL